MFNVGSLIWARSISVYFLIRTSGKEYQSLAGSTSLGVNLKSCRHYSDQWYMVSIFQVTLQIHLHTDQISTGQVVYFFGLHASNYLSTYKSFDISRGQNKKDVGQTLKTMSHFWHQILATVKFHIFKKQKYWKHIWSIAGNTLIVWMPNIKRPNSWLSLQLMVLFPRWK